MDNKKVYQNVCWFCTKSISAEFCWNCATCGWLICPICGQCKSPQFGGCPENIKGNGRYEGIFYQKNYLKKMLESSNNLTLPIFIELKHVVSESDYIHFKERHKDIIQLAKNKYLELQKEYKQKLRNKSKEKISDLVMSKKGYYKIVFRGCNYITYIDKNGIKKTVTIFKDCNNVERTINGSLTIVNGYVFIGS